MSTEGCKLGVIEMLGKTKMGKSKVDELTKKIESVMAVNEKYGGIDGHTVSTSVSFIAGVVLNSSGLSSKVLTIF
jgi:hypothetical protein